MRDQSHEARPALCVVPALLIFCEPLKENASNAKILFFFYACTLCDPAPYPNGTFYFSLYIRASMRSPAYHDE